MIYLCTLMALISKLLEIMARQWNNKITHFDKTYCSQKNPSTSQVHGLEGSDKYISSTLAGKTSQVHPQYISWKDITSSSPKCISWKDMTNASDKYISSTQTGMILNVPHAQVHLKYISWKDIASTCNKNIPSILAGVTS